MSTILNRAKTRKNEIMGRLGKTFPAIGSRQGSPSLKIVDNVKSKISARFPKVASRPMMKKILADPNPMNEYLNPVTGSVGMEQQVASLPPPPSYPPIEKVKTVNNKIIL